MKITGGTASKGEALVDSQGRLLIDVAGGGGFTPVAPLINIGSNGTFTLTGGFQNIAGAIGALSLTVVTAGLYLVSYQISALLTNVAPVSTVTSRITVNTVAVPGSDVTIGRNEVTTGYTTLRIASLGTWPLALVVGDVVEIQCSGSPGSGGESVSSFPGSGQSVLQLINYGP